MSTYSRFFLSGRSDEAELETFTIYHPDFSKVYRIVTNATQGIIAVTEEGDPHAYEHYPAKITPLSIGSHLDQAISITFGDLGEIIPLELDRVAAANGFQTLPTLHYRTWKSTDLTVPLYAAIELEVTAFSFDANGATFQASAPRLNTLATGQIYTYKMFPALRGLI